MDREKPEETKEPQIILDDIIYMHGDGRYTLEMMKQCVRDSEVIRQEKHLLQNVLSRANERIDTLLEAVKDLAAYVNAQG